MNGSEVPPGALISFIQKGIQYLQTESKISGKDQTKEETTFDMLNNHLKQKYGKVEEKTRKEIIPEIQRQEIIEPELIENMKITEDKVTVLRGHRHEVFTCAWNPKNHLVLASGYFLFLI